MGIHFLTTLWTTSILCTSVHVLAKPYSDHEQILLCADGCSCSDHIANCSGIGLRLIPALPSGITTILFQHNPLYKVSQETFKHVNHLKISHLDISYCVIYSVNADAFARLPHLITLDISGKPYSQVPQDVLWALQSTAINTLILKFASLSELPIAEPLTNITTLDISGNNFSEVNTSIFALFPNLNTLIADDNRIRAISFQQFTGSLSALSVRGNEVTWMDLSCRSDSNNSLEKLDLSGNFITNLTPLQESGHCFPHLKTLLLDYLPIRDISNNTFSTLKSLKNISMNFIGRLQNIAPMAFHSDSLEVILIGSAKSFRLSNDSDILFQNTTRLTNLTTIQLKIPERDPEFLGNFIAPLKNLRNLTLKFADISSLPERFLEHASNLISLTLVGNYFSKWDHSVFPTTNSLRYIDFGLNHITDIDETSFPAHVWDNMLMLDLSNNPFVCSCSLYWLRRKWIPNNAMKLRRYPSMYYCESPQEMKNRLVEDYYPSATDCLHPLVVMTIVLSVCLFVIIMVGAMLYKYRWHIKYYVYLCCAKRGYRKISEEDDFHFDAFVAYNSNDRIWVLTKLMPFLEKQQKFRLCLHDRDFDPGKLIADNIVDNMRKSRKLILVLSNSFTSNEWCQFELLMAQSRFLEEGSSTLILVMLEKVELLQMSGTLGVLLQNKAAIEWTNDQIGRNLFWNELLSSVN